MSLESTTCLGASNRRGSVRRPREVVLSWRIDPASLANEKSESRLRGEGVDSGSSHWRNWCSMRGENAEMRVERAEAFHEEAPSESEHQVLVATRCSKTRSGKWNLICSPVRANSGF